MHGVSCLAEDTIFLFVQRRLPELRSGKVHEHIASCESCRAVVAAAAEYVHEARHETHDTLSTQVHVSEIGEVFGPYLLPQDTPVGRYRVADVIGIGGMGVVYTALDPQLDRKVALKLVRIAAGEDAERLQGRLLREAKAMAKLSHPNVVQIYDAGTIDRE